MEPDDLRRQRDRFIGFAFAAADLLLELGAAGDIVFAEGAARGLFGLDAARLVGQPWAGLFTPGDAARLRGVLAGLKPGSRCPALRVALAGARGAALFSAYRFPGTGGTIHATLSLAPETGARSGPVEEASAVDPESGLKAGAAFAADAQRLIDQSRGAGVDARMTMLKLDGLSALPGADDPARGLIRQVGGLLLSQSMSGAAGRVAPDRFGVIHAGEIPGEEITRAVGRILEGGGAAAGGLVLRASSLPLSEPGLSPGEAVQAVLFSLKRLADGAFEAPLPNSLGQAVEAMVADTVERMATFRGAVAEGKIAIVFQPIVDLRGRKVHHYEVLARFGEDESPSAAIAFAEETGMVEMLDLAVCEMALERLALVKDPAVRIAVNLSGRSLESPGFVRALRAILATASHLAGRVMLEVTESARLSDLEQADRLLQGFRQMGFEICIDDFGAGAASFQYLQALTIDYVKLDGAYVQRLSKSRKDLLLLRAIARLCADLEIRTIAERVETEAEAAILSDIGVDLGQGWLYGKPQPDLESPKGRNGRARQGG